MKLISLNHSGQSPTLITCHDLRNLNQPRVGGATTRHSIAFSKTSNFYTCNMYHSVSSVIQWKWYIVYDINMYRHVLDMVRTSAQPLWFNAAGPFFAAFSGAICTLQAPTPLSSANRELKHDLGLQFHGIYWISCPKFLCIQSHQKKISKSHGQIFIYHHIHHILVTPLRAAHIYNMLSPTTPRSPVPRSSTLGHQSAGGEQLCTIPPCAAKGHKYWTWPVNRCLSAPLQPHPIFLGANFVQTTRIVFFFGGWAQGG